MECLSEIIGIIKTPTTALPNVTNSLSGLWLEDTSAGRVPVKAAMYNDTELIESLIPDAITEALTQLRIYTDRNLLKMYSNVHSTIGFSKDYTNYLEQSAGHYFLYLQPRNIKGSIIRIKKIVVHTSAGKHTGDIKLHKGSKELYSGPIGEFEAQTLSLDDTIYISYQGDKPLDFEHTGCCGSTPTHNGYVTVGSGVVDTITELPRNNDLPISNYCHGIEVDVTFDCDAFSFLCGTDFVRSTFGVVFAKLVQQIARKNIIYWMQTNNKVSAYATCKADVLNNIMEYLIDDIETMLNYLPENYDHSDCYNCNGIYKGEILI